MLTAIGDVMREAYERNWITARDGNISLRRGDTFYITPSGWRKNIIHPEHILKAKIDSTHNLQWKDQVSDKKPSGELLMHLMLQTTGFKHGKARAVVHLHPTYIIAALYRGYDLQKIAAEFPEISRYTKVGPNVGVLPATSRILAEETYEAMTNESGTKVIYNIVGQANHGVCAVGDHPWEAFHHIERLEHICQAVLASGVGPK
jgi:ribulose-5-phosphate 4-epimerase/fuculose-1-phosphate aldolase